MLLALLFVTMILRGVAGDIVHGKHTLDRRHVVFSFDDGPNNATSDQLLDDLRSSGVKASFFFVGANIGDGKILKRAVKEGHMVGSHSFGHKHLTKISRAELEYEVDEAERRFIQYMGDRPWFFRVPYGELNKDVAKFLTARKYIIVGWDIDTSDWKMKAKEEVIASVVHKLSRRENGGIVLMHEYEWSSAAQSMLIPIVKALGWQFSNPIDALSVGQMRRLKEWSCTAEDACMYSQTRPWCDCENTML